MKSELKSSLQPKNNTRWILSYSSRSYYISVAVVVVVVVAVWQLFFICEHLFSIYLFIVIYYYTTVSLYLVS